MKEVETKIKKGCGNGLSIDWKMPFRQVPAPWPHQQRRPAGIEFVAFSLWTRIADRALDGVPQIELAFQVVLPGGRVRVFKVGHEDVGARVQRIDDHLAVDGTSNLYTPIQQVLWNGSNRPALRADLCRLGKEVGHLSRVDALLADSTSREEFPAAWLELARQLCQERTCFGCEDLRF